MLMFLLFVQLSFVIIQANDNSSNDSLSNNTKWGYWNRAFSAVKNMKEIIGTAGLDSIKLPQLPELPKLPKLVELPKLPELPELQELPELPEFSKFDIRSGLSYLLGSINETYSNLKLILWYIFIIVVLSLVALIIFLLRTCFQKKDKNITIVLQKDKKN